MHLRLEIIRAAVENLSRLHPFFGITFLVCKLARLEIGKVKSFPINNKEEEFLLRHYHPDLSSRHYFQPFKTSGTGRWLAPKYPFSGSQSTRTRGHLANAFIHQLDTDLWGWSKNYVSVLQSKLQRDKSERVPAFWLASWLYRNKSWPAKTRPRNMVDTFLSEYFITEEEQNALFQLTIPDLPEPIFSSQIFDDSSLLRNYEPAPDARPKEGGTLRELQLRNIGPASSLDFAPAERVSIITGDNGLGKTFLLECCWWALTGQWADRQASVHNSANSATISFAIATKGDYYTKKIISFDWDKLKWPTPKGRPTIPGLIVYARVDGSFAVWDPARQVENSHGESKSGMLLFSRDEILNGLPRQIEGLIRDWATWQTAKDQWLFDIFCKVLERLSPPDMSPLIPGEPVRVPNEILNIPTLRHDYGVVPFVNESAGVRRIVTIAYLLVWAWNEHRIHSTLIKKQPQNNLVIMIDEIEAHLHPKWQRVILPSLLDVTCLLETAIKPQMIIATHSPLILASMEPFFSEMTDKLFHLYLSRGLPRNRHQVSLDEIVYIKQGTIDSWLKSEIFELKQPRSQEGENALEDAKQLMAISSSDVKKISLVHEHLSKVLPAEDPFWPRWIHFAEAKGVNL